MKRSVVVICAAAIGLAGCTGGSKHHASSTTSSPVATSTTVAAATSTTEHVADGRVPVYIKSIDVAGRTMVYDQIQFLTGDAAKQACREDHPQDPNCPEDDYIIRNVNPKLYTLPISPSAVITVNALENGGTTDKPVSLAKLKDDLATTTAQIPFWVTIRAGSITKIEEQFTP